MVPMSPYMNTLYASSLQEFKFKFTIIMLSITAYQPNCTLLYIGCHWSRVGFCLASFFVEQLPEVLLHVALNSWIFQPDCVSVLFVYWPCSQVLNVTSCFHSSRWSTVIWSQVTYSMQMIQAPLAPWELVTLGLLSRCELTMACWWRRATRPTLWLQR